MRGLDWQKMSRKLHARKMIAKVAVLCIAVTSLQLVCLSCNLKTIKSIENTTQPTGAPAQSTLVYSDPSGFSIYVGDIRDAMNTTELADYHISAIINMIKQEEPAAIQNYGDFDFSEKGYSAALARSDFQYLDLSTEDSLSFQMSNYFSQTSAFL